MQNFTKILVFCSRCGKIKIICTHLLKKGEGVRGEEPGPKLEKISIIYSKTLFAKFKCSKILLKFFATLFKNKKINRIFKIVIGVGGRSPLDVRTF